ncbi:MAG TPA: hypothetical protein GX522_03925 [Firmicutes bacterium]|nr:hypothetical protein [Bacillota bacterium]
MRVIRKSLAPILLIMMLLTGCFLSTPNNVVKGNKQLVVTVIFDQDKYQSRSVLDGVEITSIYFLLEGPSTIIQTVPVIENKAVATFNNLLPGEWKITAIAQSLISDGSLRDIFTAKRVFNLEAGEVTELILNFKLNKGTLVGSIFVADTYHAKSVQVILKDPFDSDLKKTTQINNSWSYLSFENLTPRTWLAEISLLDENNKEICKTQTTFEIKPSQVTKLNVLFELGGVFIQIGDIQKPPNKPNNLRATVQDSKVLLTWDKHLDLDSNIRYLVARSKEIDGPKTILTENYLTQNTYLDQSYLSGQYYYFVEAYSRDGLSSGWSVPVSVFIEEEKDVLGLNLGSEWKVSMQYTYTSKNVNIIEETVGNLRVDSITYSGDTKIFYMIYTVTNYHGFPYNPKDSLNYEIRKKSNTYTIYVEDKAPIEVITLPLEIGKTMVPIFPVLESRFNSQIAPIIVSKHKKHPRCYGEKTAIYNNALLNRSISFEGNEGEFYESFSYTKLDDLDIISEFYSLSAKRLNKN